MRLPGSARQPRAAGDLWKHFGNYQWTAGLTAFPTVRGRLMLLALLLVAPLAAAGAGLFTWSYGREQTAAEQQLRLTADAVALVIDRQFGQTVAFLKALATSPLLLADDIPAFAAQARTAAQGIDGWVILEAPSGQQLINTRRGDDGDLPQDPSLAAIWPDLVAGRSAVTDLINGVVAKQLVIHVAVPVTRDGEVAYALIMGLLPSSLSRVLSDQRLPSGWVGTIVDRSGTVVARSHSVERYLGRPASSSLRALLAQSSSGSGITTTLEGERVATAWSSSPAYGWTFAVGAPLHQFAAAARHAAWLAAAFGLLALSAGAGLAVWVARGIVAPVEALAGTAEALGRGEEVAAAPTGLRATDTVLAAMHAASVTLREREAALRAAEERFRATFEQAAVGVAHVDAERKWIRLNKKFCEITGYGEDDLRDHTFLDITHPDDVARDKASFDALKAGETAIYALDKRLLRKNGSTIWVRLTCSAVRGVASGSEYFIRIVEDINDRKHAEQAVAEHVRTLDTINRANVALAAELDLEKLVQAVTDAAVSLTGASFGAFFYNVLNESGESYMLYTLSGAPREAFAQFPMPRNTAVFDPTFRGEGVIRSPDILADPRYGRSAPHFGMPKGHLPVRSYLAAPVVNRAGEVVGGLFFGHPQPNVFTERAEQVLTGIAAQAAIAIDNARLFQAVQRELVARERAEQELQQLNRTLEQRVAAELRRVEAAESALRQSQKMEAIGQLTGGVAHDFNNLLQVITGNLELLRRRTAGGDGGGRDDLQPLISAASRGAERAAMLTRQLLAFSRRQPLEPRPVDVNKLVTGMSDLVRRTLGESIMIETVLAGGLWRISADPNQLESAILNLAVNARDAMPDGGKLTVETANSHLDEGYAIANKDVQPGQYVMMAVTDTGTGMAAEVAAQAFEPFFTTKRIGEGTGLGLSQVYGFIKQSGGHVKIYSEPGEGTTVKLYLPRLLIPLSESERPAEPRIVTGSQSCVVLVVEDDEDVREQTVDMLRELGYAVVEAADGPSALRLIEADRGIQVLFSDIGLPGGLNGRQLADRASRLRPDLKILYTTGYARNAIVHQGRLDPGVELIVKPFTFAALAAKLRQVIENGS
jgi:PAS domain S-box-containing protein